MVEKLLIPGMWLCWALYWWIAARGTKRNQWRESRWSRLLHGIPLVLAFVLLSPSQARLRGASHGMLFAVYAYWIGAVLTAAGLSFAIWARAHLGRNWSGTITIKVDHELITGGPYAIVRHPIYTGMLLGFVGSAIAVGGWRGVLAVALAAWAIWRRVRLEEAAMRQQFGARYEQYSKRVPALIPFIRL